MANTNPRPRGPIATGLSALMLQDVPSYANKFLYSLGLLTATAFVLLALTGGVMALAGPDWWLTNTFGQYMRSVHLWATQAFVVFMIAHIIIVFLTSAYRGPRRFTWVIGVVMFLFAMAEAEFGYVLRGDFSSQYRSLQGSDLYNGSGLGTWVNNLNTGQIMGIHIATIPLLLIALILAHYFLVKVLGIARPYRSDVKYTMTKASHPLLFLRAGLVVLAVGALAWAMPSPYLAPVTVSGVASDDSKLIGATLVAEFDRTSDTASYVNNIAPYKYDTRNVYITAPYQQLAATATTPDQLAKFNAEPAATQDAQLAQAKDYYGDTPETVSAAQVKANPAIQVVESLIGMAKNGLYEASIRQADGRGFQTTYTLRFLADTGIPDTMAEDRKMTTEQYGMVREENGTMPPGAWWLAPIGLLNHTVLANDENGDRDGAIIIGAFVFLLMVFPFIPFINRIPDFTRIFRLIWR